MTNKNLTEKVIILDRSGSMASCRDDMEGGLNTYIENQKKIGGDIRVTYVIFDDRIETPLENVSINLVGHLPLEPRGGTALLDAVGSTINSVGARLAKLPEHERPGLVDVIVVTDGGENASRKFNNSQIREMISTQENVYGWKFTFLGANQDSFATGGELGFAKGSTGNYNTEKSYDMWNNVSARSLRMYNDVQQFGAVSMSAASYTKEEQESMV